MAKTAKKSVHELEVGDYVTLPSALLSRNAVVKARKTYPGRDGECHVLTFESASGIWSHASADIWFDADDKLECELGDRPLIRFFKYLWSIGPGRWLYQD